MREKYSGRPDKTTYLEPWKPGNNAAKHGGGRWLCMKCCRYQRGSKEKHKPFCMPGNAGKLMKALSIRSPWWVYILYGSKNIENRDWSTTYRGPVLIHASKFSHAATILEDITVAKEIQNSIKPLSGIKTWGDIKPLLGHVVGQVEIVDCVAQSDSPWFFGRYGFVLQNPVVFEKPFPVRGALGLFDILYPPANAGKP